MTSFAREIHESLEKHYGGGRCSLDFRNPFELLVATILSAQCTDVRVNKVTPALFARCPDPATLAAMTQPDLEDLIRSTGFYRGKARSLLLAARMLVERFGCRVPDRMEDLLDLPGVARKTANVVLGNAFGKAEGIAVDTHVARLSRRMGLSANADPVKIERDLMALFPRKHWTALAHLLISHGRAVCQAKRPQCAACFLARKCPKIGVPSHSPRQGVK